MKYACGNGLDVEVTWTECEDPDAPVVIVWPAFGTPATFYRHLAPTLCEAGVSVLVVEYPGRDRSDGIGRATDYGYDALATQVHPTLVRAVRERHPHSAVVVLGHSLGGQVALFAAALAQASDDAAIQPEGLVLAASANPYWRGYNWSGAPRSLVGTALMALVARAVGYWPGDRLNFWGRQSRVLISDWARIARTGRIRPQGAGQDYEKALGAFTGDVLAISLPDDSLAPVAALDRLLALIPRARVTRWHSPVRLGHIQWVRRNADVVPIIVDWMRDEGFFDTPATMADARHDTLRSES